MISNCGQSYPPHPPIALQSITRDDSALCIHQRGGWSIRCDLRWMHDSVVAVAVSDGETRCSTVFESSFQACSYILLQGGLGCFQLRASTSTAYLKMRWIWCARWASKGSCLAYPFHLLRSQAVARSAVYPSLSSDGHPPSISLPRAQELTRLILSLHFFTSALHTHYPLFT